MALASNAQDSTYVKSVYFGGGSYWVTPDQASEVEKFIDKFEDFEHYEVSIASYTDNRGGYEYNKWLSEMRSFTVLEHLLQKNVPREKIFLKSNGQENSTYTNRSRMGRGGNRRVDIIILPIVM